MVKPAPFNPVSILLDEARRNHRPAEAALSDFLDYAISAFDAEKYLTHDSIQSILSEAKQQSEPYFRLLLLWLTDVERHMNRGKPCDFFGSIYEQMFQSKSKASRMGQFFTPPDVSDLMASIVAHHDGENTPQRINDPCCGSGRLLLAHYMQNATPQHHGQAVGYYVAQDIDPVSCKMCALNFMAHGIIGEVHCQDTLRLTPPVASYYVNEVRTPIPTPFYSIRKVV